MIWFFDRHGQRLRYEIRRKEAGDGYELVIGYPDGHTEIEEMLDLAESLKQEGWKVG
jgi:hypothetical protein